MTREDHLEIYDLSLTVKGPLFIGSGKSYSKKEYVFLSERYHEESCALILSQQRLFSFLIGHNLVDAYENFMLSKQGDLYNFLRSDCHLTLDEIRAMSIYRLSVGDAVDSNISLKEIHTFVRDTADRAYVPGSSVKGALRTALLTAMLLDEPSHERLPDSGFGFPEGKYLHTLALKKDTGGKPVDDAVNSILRGLYISDSQTISDSAMMLAEKIDADIDGNLHHIPIFRECIKPGTKLRFKLTLDKSVVKDRLSASHIIDSIQIFNQFYVSEWLSFFSEPRECAELSYDNCLFLGGGVGFAAKTLVYPYLEGSAAVREVSNILSNKFRDHHHDSDISLAVSPRMAKYAGFRGKLYPYGLCEVSLE